ncbi:MAG: acylneuraminate cytidylyltransferase family protein [Pseudomonadota bacterium]
MSGLTIATVCARGGSKGLPRKNLLPFAGKPLIVHSIEQALACAGLAGVHVSTDDEEIAAVAAAAGASVPYRRPAELATDEAGKLPAIVHLVRHLEAQGLVIATVVDLQPTSPLRTPADIEGALAEFTRTGAELVVSVTEPSHNPYYTLVEAQPDGTLALSKPAAFARRQDAPAVWGLNGAIYVWQRAALGRAAREGFWAVRSRPFPMPRERSVDIDDRFDFELAEWLHHRAQRAQAVEPHHV